MYWIIAIGLGLLTWGCRDKEAEPPLSPPNPNNNKAFQKPGGERYAVIVDGAFHEFYHDDKNNDKIFQASNEKLLLGDEDRYLPYGGEEFEKKRKLANLPDLNGVHLAKWEGVHQALYPSGAPKVQEGRFTRIHEFCQKHSVDFQKAWELGKKMNPNQDIEKLDALLVSSFLLFVQQGKEGSFYQSENLKGEKENKKFIDTVLQKVEVGKLGIKNVRGEPNEQYGVVQGNYYAYLHKKNILSIGRDIEPYDWMFQSGIIHETYHFYQDSQAQPLPRASVEEAAYHKQIDFTLRIPPFNNLDSSDALEKLIVKETTKHPRDQELPFYHALRHHFYQKINHSKKADVAQKNLKNSIAFYHYLRPYLSIEDIDPEKMVKRFLVELVQENLSNADTIETKSEGMEKIRVRINVEIKGVEEAQKNAKKELQKYLRKTPPKNMTGEEFNLKVTNYLRFVYTVRHLNAILEWTYPGSPDLGDAEKLTFGRPFLGDPEVQELFTEISDLYPFPWIRLGLDGVE